MIAAASMGPTKTTIFKKVFWNTKPRRALLKSVAVAPNRETIGHGQSATPSPKFATSPLRGATPNFHDQKPADAGASS
jgi:hypothetical protein